ncbi:hypothetical protein GR160_15190 [Flavobacterium sp. Sd200]|uniref:glycosyltransferase family 39 protein n=1 Tax=Flavobacterium sp. Sd200 TaxID=2692211 RepID=UPI0013714A8D|nr:glycosyltransferase family 39 protein [Flavobacterium sp. Sd200]MXN92572.1 hypothetical protein [Flavobacterium sp. Sd200]
MTLTKYLKNPALIAILVLAAVLRLYKCDYQSLWLDEVLTMNSANPKLSFREFYDSIMFWEYIPHLYYYFNRIIFSVFGYTTFVARVFSALMGIGGVYAIYLLGKSLLNKRAGLIAALLLSVNYFHISYSQEIRPYGFLFLFSILSFYRLIEFFKSPTAKNAIYYGLFTGLILHAHFFGLITIFSQCILFLVFLFLTPKQDRLNFFKFALLGGVVAIIVFLPAIEPFLRVSDIDSFWFEKPGLLAFTNMFSEFFGKSEMLLFLIQFVFIYYAITLFKEKTEELNYRNIINNKLIFGFIILFTWLSISVVIPMLKSYLDIPMLLIRYFISIIGILVLILATGISLINNRLLKIIVLGSLVLFSLIDLLAVKKYYTTVSKTQYRELSKDIIRRNPDNAKVVAYWSWIFPYYFKDTQTKIEGKSLEDYIALMRNGAMSATEPFWYADANGRTFSLSAENQAYLDENFKLTKKLEYFDAWANYYVPKKENIVDLAANNNILSTFAQANFAANGSIQMFENSTVTSGKVKLAQGKYNIIIDGFSTPDKPINSENAHIIVKFAGKEIAGIYLNENTGKSENIIPLDCPTDAEGKFEISFDNDLSVNGQDRNVTINSIKIVKQ